MKRSSYNFIVLICCVFLFVFSFSVKDAISSYYDSLWYFSQEGFSIDETWTRGFLDPVGMLVYEHGIGRYIRNNGEKEIFIPTKTKVEWESFIDSVADSAVWNAAQATYLSGSSDIVALDAAVIEGEGCNTCSFYYTPGPCSWDTTQMCCNQNNSIPVREIRCGRSDNSGGTVIARNGDVCGPLINACWKTSWIYFSKTYAPHEAEGSVGYMFSGQPATCSSIFTCPTLGSYTADPP